jgi:hypothetical protein
MIRAVTLVWLFAGIRGDEIRRLRLAACVGSQTMDRRYAFSMFR